MRPRLALTLLAITLVAFAVGLGGSVRGGPHARALTPIAGDNNCDTAVTTADVATALAGLGGLTGDACTRWAGDLDCSGAADAADLVRLLRALAGVDSGGCRTVGQPFEMPPTAYDKIDAALAANEITLGEALLYKLYADFADSRLPGEYDGPTTGPVESSLLHQVATVWDTLSPSEQAALQPYLLPPAAPGSWVEQGDIGAAAIEWDTVSSSRIKVWWQTRRPEDAAKAQAILNAMESKIYPTLVDYLGEEHAPPDDAGQPNNGGDGLYDIYLVHIQPDEPGDEPVLGYVSPYAGCELTPSYMVLNSRSPVGPELLSTVAHEFMHTLQFTYNVGSCDDYRWLFEATATWAEHFVYPRVDSEHAFGYSFLDELRKPFETWVYKDPRQYGAYLFWFFLANQYGLHDAVADTWAASGNADSLAAIESVIAGSGGFDDVWPEFARYNWNRDPYEEYTQWDRFVGGAKWKDTDVTAASGVNSYFVPTDLPHMTQDHFHYNIDDSVKSLTFINPFPGSGEQHVKVEALIHRNGQWTRPPEDWTAEDRVHLCLDREGEDVDELVIIISNSDHADRGHTFDVGPAELVASPLGCVGWSGTATAEVQYFDARFNITLDNVLFAPSPQDTDPNDRYDGYVLAQSSAAIWHASGTWPGGCTASGTMSLDPPGQGPSDVGGSLVIDREELDYQVHIGGHRDYAVFQLLCGDDTADQLWPVIPIAYNAAGSELVDENGELVADGEYIDPSETYGGTWRWRFEEVK